MRTPTIRGGSRFLLALSLLWLLLTSAGAETITYRWVDPVTGGTVISDMPPPPGARNVSRSTTSASSSEERPLPYAVRQASEKFPVVLYTTERCGKDCQDARELLRQREVPFTEKALSSEEEFADLGRLLGSEAAFPSVTIGRQFLRGFDAARWNSLLDAAGYPARANRPAGTRSP
ncbi:glutaredoxin family protein [Accumulibacter sp.]|uniref:glutaredoxin family protein n=1 Tax=Accumulibacter sp. TaxID=2053492 RepID=UPI0025FB1CC5|nr:glutaredoxin family protein [Accumulibacter sp.]MCM8610821.1 glutaredoxin family protein [Accumulibacter sp.]MCM8636359.1 glutaredoxin family protein [Accumulibacter sp.]MCM8640066.1 glutaredoxin family protein [Accumulibacter sp.]